MDMALEPAGLQEMPPLLGEMLQADGAQALRPWRAGGPLHVLPQTLEFAECAPGIPDFRFELIRRDDRSKAPYALMGFRLQAHYPDREGLTALRRQAPQAALQCLRLQQGYLRLVPIGKGLELPPPLREPQALVWNDLDRACLSIQLDGEAALLTEGLLRHDALSLLAYAEMEYAGMVPGIALRAEFDPVQLCEALAGSRDGLVSRQALHRALCERQAELPIVWSDAPERHAPQRLADALSCRLRHHLARFAAAPSPDGLDYWQLQPGTGRRVSWDLAEPFMGRHGLCLSLRPFEALAQLGDASVYLHRSALPAPGLGAWTVQVQADLPADSQAHFAVALSAPARPPRRPAAIAGPLLELSPPHHQATASLRFAPGEAPEYVATCHCRLPDGAWLTSAQPVRSQAHPGRLTLGPQDFPVRFAALRMTPRLSEWARVCCVAHGSAQGVAFQRTALLQASQPGATLCWPLDAEQGRLQVQALPLDGDAAPARIELALRSVELDLAHFPGFGPQSVAVHCEFPAGHRGALALEFAAGDEVGDSPLRLSPGKPSGHFRWWSPTPFLPMYRWRVLGEHAWSAPRPSTAPLRLALEHGVAVMRTPTPESLP